MSRPVSEVCDHCDQWSVVVILVRADGREENWCPPCLAGATG